VPAWISVMPSTSSSIWAACSSLTRRILAPIGRNQKFAAMTPQRVATNAAAIFGPSDAGSLRLPITFIRPTMQPTMPMVGA
jgi:hypothetical protein